METKTAFTNLQHMVDFNLVVNENFSADSEVLLMGFLDMKNFYSLMEIYSRYILLSKDAKY